MFYVRQQRMNTVQILVISESIFIHQPWILHLEHFFVIWWILDNLPQIQARKRPISNIVLLPCKTQLIELNSTLARQ